MEKRPPKLREILALTFLGLVLLPAVPALAAEPPMLQSAGLRADVAVLRRAYEAMHPGLYRYNTRAQMDRNFARLEAAFGRDRSLSDAYLELSRFLAKVKCGHSYANFFNQPEAVVDSLFKGQNRVPFYFRWIDRRMIVTRNFSTDSRISRGTEILSIDGVPASRILDRLLTVARADGANDAKRIKYLELTGDSPYEAFDIFFPLLFPPAGDSREFTVREFGTKAVAKLRLRSLTFEERAAPLEAEEKARKGGDEPLWRLEHLDSDTAYLRMKSWAVYDSKWDWKGFLDRSLDELSKRATRNLVVDLRGNEGGLDCGDQIISRLIDADLPLGQYRRLVRYRTAPEDLVPYLDTWDPSFRDWGAAAVGPEHGFYTLRRYDDDERGSVIAAKGPRYVGRVYVLIDAANSSATFQFAQVLKQHRLATLVGQPTGGNQRGINGGAFFFLRLPNSKVEVDLPLIGTFPIGRRPDAGITPDVVVRPSVRDIAQGIDTELAAVRRLIEERSSLTSRTKERRRQDP